MKKILLQLLFIGFSIGAFAQDSYTLESDSKLTIDGTSTVHSWTVTADIMKGSLTLQNDAPVTLNFEVAVSDIMSERGATMDKKMHAALKKEEHPKVSFILEKVKNTSSLIGALTIAGTNKTVEIDAEITSDSDSVNIKGEEKIVLQDFGMIPPTAMFGQIIVGDEVTVKFDLKFDKE